MKLGARCYSKTINRTGFVVDQQQDAFLVVWHSNDKHRPAYHWYDVNALPLWNDQAIKIDEWM